MSYIWVILIILIILVIIGWLWVLYSAPVEAKHVEPEYISYVMNNTDNPIDINIVDIETNNSVLKSQLDPNRKFDILYGQRSYKIKYDEHETVYNANKEVLVIDIKPESHLITRINPNSKLSVMVITAKNLNDQQESNIKVTFDKKTKIIRMFNMQDDAIDRYHPEYVKMKNLYGSDILDEMFGEFISQGLKIDA